MDSRRSQGGNIRRAVESEKKCAAHVRRPRDFPVRVAVTSFHPVWGAGIFLAAPKRQKNVAVLLAQRGRNEATALRAAACLKICKNPKIRDREDTNPITATGSGLLNI